MTTTRVTSRVYPPNLLPWGVHDSGFRAGEAEPDDSAWSWAATADEYYSAYNGLISVDEELTSGTRITVTATGSSIDLVPIQVYAITGGRLWFLPSGMGRLPNGELVTTDTLLLEVWASNYAGIAGPFQRAGLLPPKWIAYENVDIETFKGELERWARSVPTAEAARLEANFPRAETSDIENYGDRVLEGVWAVPVTAGTYLGWIGIDGEGTSGLRIRTFDTIDEIGSAAPMLGGLDLVDPQVAGHPVVVQARETDVESEVHLQFRYFEPATSGPGKGDWKWLAGAAVQIVDSVTTSTIEEGSTDHEGKVRFIIDLPGLTGRNFHFVVTPGHPIQRQYGRTVSDYGLSAEWTGSWSTNGWKGVGGESGGYTDFVGSAIGRSTAPAQFNVGVPVFLRVKYLNANEPAYWPAPQGARINLQPTDTSVTSATDLFYSDDIGEVWGTAFAIVAGTDVEIVLPLTLIDEKIALPEVSIDSVDWRSTEDPSRGLWEPAFSGPAIGDAKRTSLRLITVETFLMQASSFFVLKIVRDVHQLFWYLTGGSYSGIPGLRVTMESVPGISLTSAGHMTMYLDDWYSPSVIAHEYAHAVMMDRFSWLSVFLALNIRSGHSEDHSFDQLSSEGFAFIEGWAEIYELVFGDFWTLPDEDGDGVILVLNENGIGRVPLEDTMGLRVEGAIALAFYAYLRQRGMGSYKKSTAADLKEGLRWVDDPLLKDAFQTMLWTPFNDLAEINEFDDLALSHMTVSGLLAEIKRRVGTAAYDAFAAEFLHPYFLA